MPFIKSQILHVIAVSFFIFSILRTICSNYASNLLERISKTIYIILDKISVNFQGENP